MSTVTSNGSPIRWKKPYKLNFAGNPEGQSSLSSSEFFEAAVIGLQRWKEASSNLFSFDYWQGTNKKEYPTSGEFDGISSLYFLSNSSKKTELSKNILGITQVWYNPQSGDILETDIVLNDVDFYFTNNPLDTSGFGAGESTYTNSKINVFIQNVVTHELGHVLGLSHSGSLQSTMLFMESPEQAHLGCDDLVGIHSIYPIPDELLKSGFQGEILTKTGKPVFGAHVLAISATRGTSLASALTDPAGHYSFPALEPGDYFVLAEPFYAGSQSLPAFYANSNSKICPEGTLFSRSFLFDTNRVKLLPVQVQKGLISHAPHLTVDCNSTVHNINRDFTVPTLDLAKEGETRVGIVDQISPFTTQKYRLDKISGRLEIQTLGYSLYSPIHSQLSLLDSNGNAYPSLTIDPIYQGESGFKNYDSVLIAENIPFGTYFLEISTTPLQVNDFPAGPISLDTIPFLVVIGSLNAQLQNQTETLPRNSRCRSMEKFERYNSPNGPIPTSNLPIPSDQSVAGCGTSHHKSQDSFSAKDILAWLFPWLLILSFRACFSCMTPSVPLNLNYVRTKVRSN